MRSASFKPLVLAGALLLAPMMTCARADVTQQFSVAVTDTNQDNDVNTTSDPNNYSYGVNGAGVVSDGRKAIFSGNVEYGAPLTTPVHCQPTQIEYPYIGGSMLVLGFEGSDELFLRISEKSYECGNNDAQYTGTDVYEGKIAGGLGKYQNATGTWNATSHGLVLRIDSAGHLFGADVGNINVNVTIPGN